MDQAAETPTTEPEACASPAWDERARLAALKRYAILDTGREPAFDDVAELAADILDAPIAVVNFIDADRQWFKAEKGIGTDSLPLDVSICRHAILQPGVFVVPDLTKDARFEANPLVDAAGGLRFYAGALLQTPDGLPLGTVCVLDTEPRPEGVTPRQVRALQALAAQTMAQLELRRATAASREESERLSAMFAQATVGMSEIDLSGRFLVVNDRLCEILGRPREEMLTLGIFDVTHPGDLAGNTPKFEHMAETGESFSLDKRYVRPDGSIVWANSSVSRLLDGQGRPRAALAVTTDVTARKEAERRRSFLLDLGDRTRRLAEADAVVTAATEALGRELGASRVAYVDIDEERGLALALSGWTDGVLSELPAQMNLRDFEGPILEQLRAGVTLRVADCRSDTRVRTAVPQLQAIGAAAVVSVPVLKSGRLVGNFNVHQSQSRAWTDAEVELIEAVAERTWEAVERARAEAALRDSEERHRQIIEGADDFAIISLDAHGRITSWNAGAQRMTGFSAAEAVGRSGDIFFTPEDRAAGAPDHELVRALEDGRAVNERWHMRKDGSRFWGSGLSMRVEGGGFLKMFRDRTAEHEAEAALRVSEERFRTALEIETVGAIYFDMEGRLTDANDAFLRMGGYSREDLEAGRLTWQQLTPDEWMDDSHRAFAELKATGRTTPYEKQYVRKDGSRWWALFAAKLLPDGTGFEFVLDITDRKLAEQRRRALVELGDRIRDARDPDDLAYAAAEILGRTLQVSRAGYGTIDTAAETITIKRDWNAPGIRSLAGTLYFRDYGSYIEDLKRGETVVFADAELDPRTAATAEALKAISAQSVVNMPVNERGGLVALLYLNHATPRAWPEEDLALVREVAERTRTAIERLRVEAELRESEAALRTLNETLEQQVEARTAERDRMWNTSRDLQLIVGTDGVFHAVNPAWTALLGWRADELIGRSYLELIHPDDHPASQGALATASRDVLPTYENRYRHNDGSFRWISWVAAPEGHRIYASGRDVTYEKQRQAELAAAQDALRQSQKMEAMGQLTGGVAHDFNNLLTPIVGSLDMLQRRGLGGEREQRLIENALQSADRARTLVQRLLAFARRQPLQSGAVDVARLVEGMADLVSSTTGPQIRVAVEVEPDLPPAQADANQLEMAVLNLAVNARDAMPDGGSLRISAAREVVGGRHRANLAPGEYVRLSVADTGAGMDPDTLARAVEPFFSTKGVGKGTGLGLSMVHGLASQLGGAINIQSRPGLGTNVEIWVPVSRATVQNESRPADDGVALVARGTALVVDDEDLVRASTAAMLADLGYHVTEAASAEAALESIRGGLRPDLLITDHLMPGMTGTELARQARALCSDLKVLVVSGYAEVEGIAPDLPRLTKPFRNAELAASLAAL